MLLNRQEYELTEEEFELAKSIAIRYVESELQLDLLEFKMWFIAAARGDQKIAREAAEMWMAASLASMLGITPEQFGAIVNG